MKKVIGLCLMLVFCFGLLAAVSLAEDTGKIKAYIVSLEAKLEQAKAEKNKGRAAKLTVLIEEQKARLAKAGESVSVPEEDKLTDLKEETNLALKDLKEQVDKVKSDNKDAKVGATIFFRWQNAENSSTPNNFDVDRAYVDIRKKLDGGASGRVTLDVKRITGTTSGNLFDYLKYAYVELPLNVSAVQLVPFDLTAKVGLQHTAWIDWADKIMDQRYIYKGLIDNEGVMSSSDFGLAVLGKVSVAGLPEIEYQGTLINGSGYATNEANKQKDVGLRLSSTVYDAGEMGKVIVGALANVKNFWTDDLDGATRQIDLLAAWKADNGVVYAEYLRGTGISGYSAGGKYMFLPGTWAFARATNYDPDTTKASNEINRNFYGLTYDWSNDVKLAADVQTAQTGNGAVASTFYLHSLVSL
jgi:hypothetical protein